MKECVLLIESVRVCVCKCMYEMGEGDNQCDTTFTRWLKTGVTHSVHCMHTHISSYYITPHHATSCFTILHHSTTLQHTYIPYSSLTCGSVWPSCASICDCVCVCEMLPSMVSAALSNARTSASKACVSMCVCVCVCVRVRT
jgi:hypothetical protein